MREIDWIGKSQALRIRVRDYINGRWKPEAEGEAYTKYASRDGRLLCRVPDSSPENIAEAVAVARQSFADGRWADLPVQTRKDILLRLASKIEKHREELALLECLDVGKPIHDVLSFDIPAACAFIRYNAEAADKISSTVFASDRTSLSYQIRRPLGVVAGIVGWNFPLHLAAGKIAPALAAGNSLVLKPSEVTSLCTARLAELAVEAGVPEGVFNVVHGSGSVGSALAHHSEVDLITFTGSTSTGKALMMAAANSNMKRTILECGGKSPNIVFDDSPNLEAVAEGVLARAFWNQGQVCTASSRLLVQENVKAELLELLVKKAADWVPGDPLRPETRYGALVSREHHKKILDYIELGFTQGANVVFTSGVTPPFADGVYLGAVIMDQVTSVNRIAQEEIFGPVLAVMTFHDEEEAIRIANETVYGLSAIVWTRSLQRAHRMSQRINAGWISVQAAERPAGGPGEGVVSVDPQKQSGIGVEGGLDGLAAYMSKTAIQFFV